MRDKGINSMIFDAMAKLCENRCKDSESCNSMCKESQYLIDMIFKYPVTEFDLEDNLEGQQKGE